MTDSRSQSVWIVQGTDGSGVRLGNILRRLGLDVRLFSCMETAKTGLSSQRPQVIFVEGFPDHSTISQMENLQELSPHTYVISMAACDNSSKLKSRLSSFLLETATNNDTSDGSANDVYRLSVREREILRLMVKGLINKEIAEAISISYYTVENHQRKIYEKLKVHTRTAAVTKALLEKIVQTT